MSLSMWVMFARGANASGDEDDERRQRIAPAPEEVRRAARSPGGAFQRAAAESVLLQADVVFDLLDHAARSASCRGRWSSSTRSTVQMPCDLLQPLHRSRPSASRRAGCRRPPGRRRSCPSGRARRRGETRPSDPCASIPAGRPGGTVPSGGGPRGVLVDQGVGEVLELPGRRCPRRRSRCRRSSPAPRCRRCGARGRATAGRESARLPRPDASRPGTTCRGCRWDR